MRFGYHRMKPVNPIDDQLDYIERLYKAIEQKEHTYVKERQFAVSIEIFYKHDI